MCSLHTYESVDHDRDKQVEEDLRDYDLEADKVENGHWRATAINYNLTLTIRARFNRTGAGIRITLEHDAVLSGSIEHQGIPALARRAPHQQEER